MYFLYLTYLAISDSAKTASREWLRVGRDKWQRKKGEKWAERGGLLCYAISQTVAFAIRTYVAAQTQSVRLSLPRLHDKLNTHHTNPHILANYDLQSASSLCNAVITGRDKHWSVLNVCVCVCVLVVLGYTDSQSLCMRQPRAGSMTPS